MMPRRASARAGGLCLALTMAACGGSPTQPAPPPPPPPPVVNQLPVINSITVSATRVEVDTDVTFTAAVTDAETSVAQLRFDWKTDLGNITGTGPSVTLRVPKGTATPADAVVALTVVETYQAAGGVRVEQAATSTAPTVRVHDSLKEIGDLALSFLRDFANSSVPAEVAVRDFSDSCRGKVEERDQIADNRRDYQITRSSLALERASVSSDRLRGDARVACEFWSVIKQCPAGVSCTVGSNEHVRGNCDLTTVYEQNRWRLCTSNFNGELLPSMASFIRIGASKN